MNEEILISLTVIVVGGIAAQYLAWRFRLPAILLLLLFGMVVGPATGWINTDELFGELLFPFVSLAVAVILFEGGLSLRFREVRGPGKVVWSLVTIGAVSGWLLTTLAGHWLLKLPWELAILLGAILVVTGPTVIIPLLRHVRPAGRIGAIIKWEGIIIDPVGAVLAVLVYEAIAHGSGQPVISEALRNLFMAVLVGSGIGLAGALVLIAAIRRHLLPDLLQNSVVLIVVLGSFVTSNLLQGESGLLAVTIMGIILANQKSVSIERVAQFKEDLRVLLISVLFIVLSARIRWGDMTGINIYEIAFLAALILVVRPVAVALATFRSGLNRPERIFLAWMAPRGIVAASVSSVFALRLVQDGYAEAARLMPLTFLVIIGTVAFYGLTSSVVGRRLGISQPNPQGVLILGAHRLARQIAQTLAQEKISVVLVDTSWAQVRTARMEGLPVIYSSIFSQRVIEEAETSGLGRLLTLTSNDEVNALAALRFARVFDQKEVYQLPSRSAIKEQDSEATAPKLSGRVLFSEEANFHNIYGRFLAGAAIKKTRLTEEFDFEALKGLYHKTCIPMFLIDKEGRLEVIAADSPVKPESGDTLISLVEPVD